MMNAWSVQASHSVSMSESEASYWRSEFIFGMSLGVLIKAMTPLRVVPAFLNSLSMYEFKYVCSRACSCGAQLLNN